MRGLPTGLAPIGWQICAWRDTYLGNLEAPLEALGWLRRARVTSLDT
jgi:hypothetical protein